MSGGANAKNGKERVTLPARIRTLVVDDSPFMLKLLAQILKQMANFDLVGTATNGGQALRQVSALSLDLVLKRAAAECAVLAPAQARSSTDAADPLPC